jgi:hypothetical protein
LQFRECRRSFGGVAVAASEVSSLQFRVPDPLPCKGRSSQFRAPQASSCKRRSSAFLAAAFVSRCHPEPIRAKRGWVRDLLFLSLFVIPSKPISIFHSRRCLSPLPFAVAFRCHPEEHSDEGSLFVSRQDGPVDAGVAFAVALAVAFAVAVRCHPERAKRQEIVLRSFASPVPKYTEEFCGEAGGTAAPLPRSRESGALPFTLVLYFFP